MRRPAHGWPVARACGGLLPVLAALLLGACAKEAADLVPFPCAKDQTCPTGLACYSTGCAPARRDAPCGRATRCSAAVDDPNEEIGCGLGACVPPCVNGSCPAGRICVHQDGVPWCLLSCSTNATCPDRLVCRDTWIAGRKVCLGEKFTFPACTAVEVAAVCDTYEPPAFQCGAEYFQVRCLDGTSTCTLNSTCNAAGTSCTCTTGFLGFGCDGTACRLLAGGCKYPDWGCAPAPAPTCADDRSKVEGSCVCLDGTKIRFGCGEPQTCEEWCALALTPQQDGGLADARPDALSDARPDALLDAAALH